MALVVDKLKRKIDLSSRILTNCNLPNPDLQNKQALLSRSSLPFLPHLIIIYLFKGVIRLPPFLPTLYVTFNTFSSTKQIKNTLQGKQLCVMNYESLFRLSSHLLFNS